MSKTTNPELGRNTAEYFIDGRSVDTRAIQKITQEWIDHHMKNRENEFTRQADCTVFCGTWNVNAKKQEGSLHDWLLPTAARADVYAVGFQEIVDLNAMNVALNSNNTQSRAQFWSESIADCLKSTGIAYRAVAEKFLVGLYLVVFVRESLVPQVRDVRTAHLGVGLMGMMGNKGGVLVRFSLFDSTLCFVCAHLAAHRENVAGRNSDFKNIFERALFLSENADYDNNLFLYDNPASATANSNSSSVTISASSSGGGEIVMPTQGAGRYLDRHVQACEHDVVFWLGDLNYRIDDALSTQDVFECIAKNDLEKLRVHDQLNIERAQGRVFRGFQEGVIQFLPTYKYQPGTDLYEQRPEKKLRAPAWCDRVLWRVGATPSPTQTQTQAGRESVSLLDYRRAALLPSDHKPVSAYFQCAVKQVVEKQEIAVFKELVATLQKFSRDAPPQVELSNLKIDFDTVLFEAQKETTIGIRNVGESVVCWRFVPKLEERRVYKRWLSLDKRSGLLLPGEKCDIKLVIKVDRKTAHALYAGKDTLQDVLLLRIERSVDHFAEVKANFERSSYGMSLEELVQIPTPVSSLPLPVVNPDFALSSVITPENAQPLSIPKELWRLVDALWAGEALREKELFNTAAYARPAEVASIRLALDRGQDFSPCVPQSVVEALLTFLSSLPRPLLPPELYPNAALDQGSVRPFSRQLLESLAPLNYNVLIYIMSFLREALAEDSYNRCSVEQLSSMCVERMTSAIFNFDEEFLNQTKEERERREARQAYMQTFFVYLLTTNVL